jgi:hypothetical protein
MMLNNCTQIFKNIRPDFELKVSNTHSFNDRVAAFFKLLFYLVFLHPGKNMDL